ncbi:MAG: hypothetical protein LBU89_00505 [Fibromonadaceae bacterium]|jgi:hypothetical protein|nr:hypothetical protein [Fibromonadaceae bacterium]
MWCVIKKVKPLLLTCEVKIILTFSLIFGISIFADVCDFEYSGDHYARKLEYPLYHIDLYDPFHLAINESDTMTSNKPNGEKFLTIYTILGDRCLEISMIALDSIGNLITSLGHIMKDHHILQITFDNAVWDIIHSNTPCNFTVVEPSGEKITFHLDDVENIFEYEKLKKFPHAVEIVIKSQLLECEKYKKYKEYLKDIEWMVQFIRCLDKEESCD